MMMETTEKKICNLCKIEKDVGEFLKVKHKSGNLGLMSKCKDCKRAHFKQYRENNKEKVLEREKQYRQNNREKIKQHRQDNREKILEKKKKYYQENKEKILENHKLYWQDNKDKYSEQRRQYYQENREKISEHTKQYRQNNVEKMILKGAEARAKRKGREFNLDLEDIVLPEYCPVLDIKLEVAEGKTSPNSYTLDRIDNNKGYVKGNVEVISWRANQLKNDATIEELEKIIQYMRKQVEKGDKV